MNIKRIASSNYEPDEPDSGSARSDVQANEHDLLSRVVDHIW